MPGSKPACQRLAKMGRGYPSMIGIRSHATCKMLCGLLPSRCKVPQLGRCVAWIFSWHPTSLRCSYADPSTCFRPLQSLGSFKRREQGLMFLEEGKSHGKRPSELSVGQSGITGRGAQGPRANTQKLSGNLLTAKAAGSDSLVSSYGATQESSDLSPSLRVCKPLQQV